MASQAGDAGARRVVEAVEGEEEQRQPGRRGRVRVQAQRQHTLRARPLRTQTSCCQELELGSG